MLGGFYMSAIPHSTTTTQYGTVIKRYLDLEGNFSVVRRKYIPSEGSKFKKVGIESITKYKSSSAGYNNKYSVVRKGLRESYSLEGLKKLFKDLNIQNIVGHTQVDFLSSQQKLVIKMLKQGKW